MINIRKACLIILFLAVSICNPCLNVNMVGAQSTALEPVTIQLRWFHQFQFAGYYAAIEKGFYAEEGLRVSLREFEPGKDRIAPVLEGKAQYGVGDPSLLKLRLQGQPLVVLAQIFQHSPSVLITRRESGVFSPEELAGKKVMMPLGDFGSAAIQVMILDALGDLNRVSLIPQTYNHEKLITGDIDAMATYLSNEPFKLKSKGVAVNVIDPRSFGIDFYGDNLFTTEKEVDQHPDRVKKMIRATLKGWEYALEHKGEIIDLILKEYNPALGRNQLGYEAKVVDQMIVPDLVPIGEINPRRYERIAETYRRLGISQSSTVPEGFIYRTKPEPAVLLTAEERAWLAAHPDILIGYTDVFEPEVIANPDGSHRGILVDFLDELNRRLGTRIRLRIDPIPELLGKAQKRETDGILNILPEYADKLGLLKTDGYLTGYGAVFTRKNIVFDRPSDLAGKKVAIIDDVMFTKLIVERYGAGATILKVNDALEGLQLVDRGEVDLFLGASINAYFLSKYQLFGLVLQYVYYSHPYTGGMAIRPDWPELVTILNKGIASFSNNEINAIVAKWANVPGQKKTLELTDEEQTWLKANPRITVGVSPIPPYMFAENGKIQGSLVDMMESLVSQVRLTADFSMQPLAETLSKIESGQLHVVLGMIHSQERAGFMYFSENVMNLQMSIFARTSRSDVHDAASLENKVIASFKGYGFEPVIKKYLPNARIIRADDTEGMLRLVASGKADAALQELHSGEFILRDSFINGVNRKGSFDPPGLPKTTGSEFAVSRKFPLLNSILNKSYNALPETEKNRVWRKWFADDTERLIKKQIQLTAEEQAWLREHPIITLGGGNFPPLEFFDETKGQSDGVGPDYAKLIGSMLGIEFKLVSGDWQDILNMAKSKKIDGIRLIYKSTEREKYLNYTKPYVKIANAIVTQKKTRGVSSLKDLSHKRVGTLKGIFAYHYMKEHYPDIDLIAYPTWEKALRALVNNELEAIVGTLPVTTYMINKLFITNLKVVALPPEIERNIYLGIRPDWPELTVIINKAIDAITIKQHSEIKKKWVALYTEDKESEIAITPEEQAWLDQNHTVRVRAADWPPYLIIKENDPPQGIAIEYLKLIEERTGLTFEYEEAKQPFAEFLESIKQRQGPDMTPLIAQTPDREQYLSFTTPYISSPYVIFAREQEEILLDIGGLSGKALAVPKGFIIQQLLERDYPEIRLVLFENDEQSLVALSSGKVDAYIGNLTVASHLIQKRGLSNLRVVAPTPYGDQVLSMGNRNDWPELTTIIDKALASITEAEKTDIRNKYVALRVEQGINRAAVFKWALIVSGSTLGIVFLFVFWNRSLAKKVRQRTDELESSNESLVSEVVERTKAEKALRESRNYLENLTNSLPDAVFLVKMPERVIEWANGTDNVLGYEPGECVGKTTEFLYPDRKDFIEFGDKIQRAIAAGDDIFHIEQTLKNKSGDLFPVDIDVSLFRIDQSVVSVTAIVRNITNRKRAEQEIQLYQQRLKALAAQLTIAEEKERRRIAADLHDHVGHSLALARMQLNGILESDSALERKILVKDISNIMLQALRETRSLIFELSTQSINDIGLAAAISEWLEKQVEKRHGLKAEFSGTIAKKHQKTLDENVQTLLFRSVRELFTNVVKHARANKVAVHIGEQDNDISITIEDDGIGFDRDAVKAKNGPKGGFGLFSIQERMANMGGAFDIQSEPGKGCRVVLTVPVGEGRRD